MAGQGSSKPPSSRPAEAARWAALLFAAAGVLAFVSLLAPGEGDRHATLVVVLGVVDLVVAAAIARRAPDRWQTSGLVVVAGLGLLLAFLFALVGGVPSFGYPTFFLLLFAWIGVALPRGWGLRLAVPAAAAYVVPLIVRDAPAELLVSAAIVVPMMVLIAEVMASVVGRLSMAARSDELTGVGNRRRADELLREIAPGDAVIMIDLDHFKRVNDSGGHAAGDHVLAELGSTLRSTVRDRDLVARYGGEEFLVIAPNAGQRAAVVAERIVEAWRRAAGRPTLSLGVAVHEPPESSEDTLQRADAAVYAAKRAGRDRICVADPA
jgi:diguanylate cyclase (GGDEF)-like protein